MSGLYLYALAGEHPPPVLPLGLAGEPLSLVPLGRFSAIVGELAARPAVTPEALARHDEVVRRLATLFPALLPARFGEWLPDPHSLAQALSPRAAEIARALALVHGCVQMNLRVFGEPSPDLNPPPGEPGDSGGLGTRYLAARRRAVHPGIPEVAALREALRPLLRAERIERHRPPLQSAETGPQLLATARDLVSRAESDDYLRIVEDTASTLAGRRVTVSGPFPPYAFAPAGLGGAG